jgi:UDP-3-O-[3-hydroxymyristoyl] glucosamine N-acyltransferase
MIASQSGIAKSVCPGEIVSGTPAMPHRRWLRVSNLLARLPEMSHTVRDLEKRLNILEMEQHKE